MTAETDSTGQEDQKIKVQVRGGSSGAVYGLGLIGACAYFISRSTSLQEKLIGCLKGLVWPALLVYRLFEFLEKD